MARTIVEMVIFDGMDRSSKRQPSSTKEPMKYSSASWMSSWKLYKPSLRTWYEMTKFFNRFVVGEKPTHLFLIQIQSDIGERLSRGDQVYAFVR